MLDGKCPKCGLTEVRRRYQGLGLVDRGSEYAGPYVRTGKPQRLIGSISITGRGDSPDGWAYVCVACGHWEHYISDKELLLRVADDWERVPVSSERKADERTK